MTRIAGLVCALAISFAACGQSGKVYRIGMLEIMPASVNRANLDALLRGLREAGYAEGRNIIIDYRYADAQPERFPELAADLVRAKPDIILTRGTPAAQAAKTAGAIPIVMISAANPVGAGVVADLARPGGRVTGLTSIVNELHGKRIELLREIVPGVKRVAFLSNMSNPNALAQWKEIERAARSLGMEAQAVDIRGPETFNQALEAALRQGAGAVLTSAEGVVIANRRGIIDFAATHKVPVMYSSREFVEDGGLVSYGVHYRDLYYRAASYVDKILKGAKPGDLPIEQPTKVELVINLKTAKALGISVPRDLLARADEVIR